MSTSRHLYGRQCSQFSFQCVLPTQHDTSQEESDARSHSLSLSGSDFPFFITVIFSVCLSCYNSSSNSSICPSACLNLWTLFQSVWGCNDMDNFTSSRRKTRRLIMSTQKVRKLVNARPDALPTQGANLWAHVANCLCSVFANVSQHLFSGWRQRKIERRTQNCLSRRSLCWSGWLPPPIADRNTSTNFELSVNSQKVPAFLWFG